MATEELALAILPRRQARLKSGYQAASFEAVMALHERMVVGTAYRLLGRMEDAQDAAQEVFLRLLKNLNRIEGDPKPWLYRVTVNICNDHYRRRPVTSDPEACRKVTPTFFPSRIFTPTDHQMFIPPSTTMLAPVT